jgi:hypothetical protein
MIKYEPLILTVSHGFTAIAIQFLCSPKSIGHIYLSFIMCCCCDDAAYSASSCFEFFTTRGPRASPTDTTVKIRINVNYYDV